MENAVLKKHKKDFESWLDHDSAVFEEAKGWKVVGEKYGGKGFSDGKRTMITGDIVDCDVENLETFLCSKLVERMPEWNIVKSDIREVVETMNEDGQTAIIFHILYASPAFMVAPRDCLYMLVKRDLPNGGFQLSCRTLEEHPKAPLPKGAVRLWFECSHRVDVHENGTATLSFYQDVDVRGWVPSFLISMKGQCETKLVELKGFREMCSRS